MPDRPEVPSEASQPPRISVSRSGPNAALKIEITGLPEMLIELAADQAAQIGLLLLGSSRFEPDDPNAFSESPTLSAKDQFFEVARSDNGDIVTSFKIRGLRPIILQWSPELADYLFAEIGRARGHIA